MFRVRPGPSVKTFYNRNLQMYLVFLPHPSYLPSLMFVGKARRLPRLEHLKGAAFVSTPDLSTDNRLRCNTSQGQTKLIRNIGKLHPLNFTIYAPA